jgi:hypothetical protein
MSPSARSRARWAIIAFLAATAGALWEIGADASRLRIVLRVLGGQTVSLDSAGASDTYVFVTYFVESVALAWAIFAFVSWRRRSGRGSIRPLIALGWWVWLVANIALRLGEVTFKGSSSLSYLRTFTIVDLAASVLLAVSLVGLVVVVRRADVRIGARDEVEGAEPGAEAEVASDEDTEGSSETEAAVAGRRTPASRRVTSAFAVAGVVLIVAPLALAFVVSNGTQKVTHTSTAPKATAWQVSNSTASSCADAMFQPAGAVSAGENSLCAHMTLGASLFAADCTTGTKLPKGLWPEIFDSSGQTSALGTVQAGGGACTVTTKSTTVTAAVFAGDATGPTNEPGSIIVVADFIPAANTAGLNTLGVRVSSADELDIALGSGGDYAVIESVNGAAADAVLQGSFSETPGSAPDLSKPVRLVVSVQGKTATVYIDGRLLGTGPTAVPDTSGGCGFSISTSDATKPVAAKLLRLDIFAAS